MQGAERGRDDAAQGENEDPERALPHRQNHAQGLEREEEEPRSRSEPAAGQEAGQRRQGQSDGRHGTEEEVSSQAFKGLLGDPCAAPSLTLR